MEDSSTFNKVYSPQILKDRNEYNEKNDVLQDREEGWIISKISLT